MSEQPVLPQNRIIQIGPDHVTVTDKEVIIEAKREMVGWSVRDFNAIPIYFEDKKYYLVQKLKAPPPHAFRYVLLPWAEGQQTNTQIFYAYDQEAIDERDSDHRSGVRDELVYAFLLPFYPFLGLFWSGTQQRLGRFDFVPRSITSISIFTVFCMVFGQGVFVAMSMNAAIRSGHMLVGGMICGLSSHDHLQLGPISIPLLAVDGLLLLACLADMTVRYSHYLRDDDWYGGFLEWAIPKQSGNK